MRFRGIVKNGQIELENGEVLPDGTEVRVEVGSDAPAPMDQLGESPDACVASEWALSEATLASETLLARDWLRPEEDAAWRNL
jgi:predicted component of type VI protein secretion system